MTGRDRLGVASGLAGALLTVVAATRVGYLAAVPAAVSLTAAAGTAAAWPRMRRWLPWTSVGAGLVSLGATGAAPFVAYGSEVDAGMTGMVEVAGLLVLLALVVRWSPARPALVAGTVVALAAALWILRFVPASSPLEAVGAVVLWAAGPAAATVAGGYPRWAAYRIAGSVAEARRAQRRELADDLHDFIAHEVTGMVVQAQAARYAARDDPAGLLAGLERIEAAGLRALAVMDQLVGVLRDGRAAASGPATRFGLADLPDLVARFEAQQPPGTARVTLSLREPGEVPSQIAATAYRVVVEALTNVRRHAPAARHVAVEVTGEAGRRLRVAVTNDVPRDATGGPGGPPRAAPGGVGLVGLRERVAALGGSLVAGREAGEWRLRADLPLGPPRSEEGGPDG